MDYLTNTPRYPGCSVTPLIDGAEYGRALRDALVELGEPGQFVLIAGWWLGLARGGFELVSSRQMRLVDAPPYCLNPWPDGAVPFQDPPDESTALLDLLAEKQKAGVEIWVLGWVSPLALRMSRVAKLLGGAHAVAINTLTARSLQALRQTGVHALPSTVGHLAGSMHSKIALVCDGENTVGFAGGLDLELSRWARTDHAGRQIWHDVVARVEGPAVQSIYDHFRTLWEANRLSTSQSLPLDGGRFETVPDGVPALLPRVVPVLPDRGDATVQALRTLPAARYGRLTPAKPAPLPEASLFSYRDALRQAIGAARSEVYLEDPLLWSTEVMDWLNAAVRAEPELQVTIVTGAEEDPNDPPLPHPQYLCQAINQHLLPGLDGSQRERVRAFRRTGVVVHAKTVVVDRRWAVIGSCNIARRSLYTDIEFGFGFVSEQVADYRDRLEQHHQGQLEPLPLPVPELPLSRRGRNRYDAADDPDSRARWSPRLF